MSMPLTCLLAPSTFRAPLVFLVMVRWCKLLHAGQRCCDRESQNGGHFRLHYHRILSEQQHAGPGHMQLLTWCLVVLHGGSASA